MKLSIFKACIIVVLFCQCASSSIITGAWRDPAATPANYKKVFIATLTESVTARQMIEDQLALTLQEFGLSTVKSIDVFPPEFHRSMAKKSDLALEKITQTNSDAILTIALLDKTSETRYVPNSMPYPVSRFGYYGTFGFYYDYWYGNFNNMGYYTTDNTYYLETNLYDVKTQRLIWSAQSETYNPSSINDFLVGYKKALSQQLKKDKIFSN